MTPAGALVRQLSGGVARQAGSTTGSWAAIPWGYLVNYPSNSTRL
jgi:hypothetical protein